MNTLTNIELLYETLVPITKPNKTFLSVGTITLSSFQEQPNRKNQNSLSEKELHLDFNRTSVSFYPKESHVILHASLTEFEPKTFEDEYQKLGLTAKDLNYDFFASLLPSTYVTEVYTEYAYRSLEFYFPVTLKSIQLHFADGSFLDYSDHISVFALADLAKVA